MLQVRHGGAVLVGNTEIAHLALLLQPCEGTRDLLTFHQRVRAVQEQDVEVRGIEPLQDRLDRLNDVLVAEIEALRRSGRIILPANAYLRLQHHALTQRRHLLEQPSEDLLGPTVRVDIRVVEEVDPQLERGIDEIAPLLLDRCVDYSGTAPTAAQPHAAGDQARHL